MKRPRLDEVEREITALDDLTTPALQQRWRELYKIDPPPRIRSGFLRRAIAYRLQELVQGGLKPATKRQLRQFAEQTRLRRMGCGAEAGADGGSLARQQATPAFSRQRIELSVGTRLVREWNGVTPDGFVWRGKTYRTLSAVACAITGTKWSGPKFFGLGNGARSARKDSERSLVRQLVGGLQDHVAPLEQNLQEEEAMATWLEELTDLPNRTAFNARLEDAFASSASSGRRFALISMDLDKSGQGAVAPGDRGGRGNARTTAVSYGRGLR